MKALCAVSLIALVALGGCVSEAEKDRREEARRIEVAQQAVAQELRDPSSAQFSEVEYYDYDVCGIVRGKNAFGGYGEPVKFSAIVRRQSQISRTSWKRRFCSEITAGRLR